MRPRLALIGVSDKQGVAEFAAGLVQEGVALVATGGTERCLREAGLPVTSVSELTGHPEMLSGRVKTLHPAIHAGILARRERAEEMEALESFGYRAIDMVVCNLYPFAELRSAGASPEAQLEAIDIGGPTMLRAAAKNWRSVAAVSGPQQYQAVLDGLRGGQLSDELLSELARRAFEHTAAYDAQIASYLTPAPPEGARWPRTLEPRLELRQKLRYGENPHQEGALYANPEKTGLAGATQLQGPELSYTNWLDAEAALRLVSSLEETAAVVVKHGNPCGVAVAPTSAEAFAAAYRCDPRSAYGGVVGLNRRLDAATAAELAEHFLLLLVVPGADPEPLGSLRRRKSLRILEVPGGWTAPQLELRSVSGGVLAQQPDRVDEPLRDLQVVSRRSPTTEEWEALRLAWRVVAGVRSNAIVLCREGMAVGIGAGQMSRVEAVELAVSRAGERAKGSCLASDAYFPMADNLEVAAAAGVTAAIHPGGSVRDQEVVQVADRNDLALVVTGYRHFRH